MAQLVASIIAGDDALAAPMDAEALVGALKDKVDDTNIVLSVLEMRSASLKAQAQVFLDKAKAMDRNNEAINKRVHFIMTSNNFERLPGNLWAVKLVDVGGQQAVTFLREPYEVDREMTPDLVDYIPARLAWNKDEVRKQLLRTDSLLGTDIATVALRGKKVKWEPAEALETKRVKKGKKHVDGTSDEPAATALCGEPSGPPKAPG